MKKQFTAWMLILCLLLAGCQSAGNAQGDLVETPDLPGQILNAKEPTGVGYAETVGMLKFQAGGRLRIPYTGAASQVQYITSVEQLPDDEAFKKYDAEFFKTHALILVTQTTGSGSVQMDIESVYVEDGVAKVTLKQTMDGDVGTADMAAWLIWAEVEAGLNLQWQTVSNTMNELPKGEID